MEGSSIVFPNSWINKQIYPQLSDHLQMFLLINLFPIFRILFACPDAADEWKGWLSPLNMNPKQVPLNLRNVVSSCFIFQRTKEGQKGHSLNWVFRACACQSSMVLTVFACNSVDKVMELASEPCPKPRTHVPQNLNLMGGEKVNREQRLVAGSVRREDARG